MEAAKGRVIAQHEKKVRHRDVYGHHQQRKDLRGSRG